MGFEYADVHINPPRSLSLSPFAECVHAATFGRAGEYAEDYQ